MEYELEVDVWECWLNKWSGPDGYIIEFFQKISEIKGEEVIEFVKEFQVSKYIPRGCNVLFISLIPKVTDVTLVSEKRLANT